MSDTPFKRKYSISDYSMLEYSKTLRSIFLTDQAEFVTKDPDFDNPFEDDWQLAVEEAEAQSTDETVRDQLQDLSQTVDEEMELSRIKFQDSKYFIKKAFPKRPGIWNEFGFDDYDSVRQTQGAFITFMETFHKVATKYSAQLAAVNYGAPLVAEIATRKDALDTANKAQELFKNESLSTTETRIIKLNAVWDFNTQVCELGKVISRTSPAKYQQYTLPPSQEPAGTLVLRGKLTNAAGDPVEGVQTELQPHGLQSISDSNGMYGYGTAPAGPATLRIISVLYPEQNIPVVIDPDNPQVLDVQLETVPPPPPPAP